MGFAGRREPSVQQLLGEAELGHARIAPAPLARDHDERDERPGRVAERPVVDAGEALDQAGADRVEAQRAAGQQLARGGHDRLGSRPSARAPSTRSATDIGGCSAIRSAA